LNFSVSPGDSILFMEGLASQYLIDEQIIVVKSSRKAAEDGMNDDEQVVVLSTTNLLRRLYTKCAIGRQ